jgi:hypothetical protein
MTYQIYHKVIKIHHFLRKEEVYHYKMDLLHHNKIKTFIKKKYILENNYLLK